MAGVFYMGGYAAFVWPAWGLTALVMVGLVAISLWDLRAQRRFLADLEGEAGPRPRRKSEPVPDRPAGSSHGVDR